MGGWQRQNYRENQPFLGRQDLTDLTQREARSVLTIFGLTTSFSAAAASGKGAHSTPRCEVLCGGVLVCDVPNGLHDTWQLALRMRGMERVDDGGGSVVITRRWSGERLDRREGEGSLALLSDCSVGAGCGRGRRA